MNHILPVSAAASTAAPVSDGFPPIVARAGQRVTTIGGPEFDDLTDTEFATLAEHVQRDLDVLLAERGHATRATVTVSGGAR